MRALASIIYNPVKIHAASSKVTLRRFFRRLLRFEDDRLRETLERYRTLVDDINEVYVVIRGERIVFANQRCVELLGIPADDLMERTFWGYVAPESKDTVREIYQATMNEQLVPDTWDATIVNAHGRKTPVEIRFKKAIYEGKPAYSMLIRDISARKRAEQELIQRNKRLEVITELTRIIGSSLDIRDIYQAFTNEVKRIIDFDRASIVLIDGDNLKFFAVTGDVETGLREGDIIPLTNSTTEWVKKNKRSNIETDFTQEMLFPIDERHLLRSGLRSAIRVPLLSKGEVFGTFNLTSRHPDAYGETEREILEQLAGQIAVAVENSLLFIQIKQRENELLKAYAELKAAQDFMIQSESLRVLGQMASGVAHDFNNMLSVILGRAQLALSIGKDPKVLKHVKIIEQAATDGAKTVRRLQDTARVRVDRQFEAVHVGKLVQSALQMVEPRRLERRDVEGVTIEISTQIEDEIYIEGDSAELREVLTNIIFNAMDAMNKSGPVTVRSKIEGGWITLSITDTGVGIPDELKGRLFDPFFTTKSPRGLGMGLAVAYGIVKRHRGTIEVESSVGIGSTFYIKLPVATSPSRRLLLPEEPTVIKRASILIIDDDAQTNEVLRLMLVNLGHQAKGFTSAKDGLSAFKKGDYDAVITDMGLKDMSGREVARKIKELRPETTVILITGWGKLLDTKELSKDGIDGVISKPFSKESLNTKLAELLPSGISASSA